MEFYLAIEKNEIIQCSGETEIIMLSEISQSHRDKYFMFSLICASQGKTKQQNTTPGFGV
jgi:hypothetical protein